MRVVCQLCSMWLDIQLIFLKDSWQQAFDRFPAVAIVFLIVFTRLGIQTCCSRPCMFCLIRSLKSFTDVCSDISTKGWVPKDCLAESVIYQATVNTSDKRSPETCMWRINGNKSLMPTTKHHSNKQNCTELDKHIWDVKQKNIEHSIRRRILKWAKSYSIVSKRCNLCLWEKYFLICKTGHG